ncbi:MAG: PAS domain S-box protein [Ignavibacteria bacterium]|nr:PAS domain S-box protein [Ignavibacteria bacterium]
MKKHDKKEKVRPSKSFSAAKKKMKSVDVQLKDPKQIEAEKQKKTAHLKIKPVPIQESDKVSETRRVKRDITDRKHAEEARRENEEELQRLLESMTTAFVLFESVFADDGRFVSYRFVYINKAYERITGVKNDEVKGKTTHEVWPKTEPEWIKRYGEVAITGVSQTFEMYHEPTAKYYHCNVYRPGDTQDRFCVVFEDITESKQMEEALRESKTRYDIAMQFSKDGLYDWNLITNEIYYSPGWKKMLGYEDKELINDFSVWELLTEPEDVKNTMTMVNELIEKKRDRFEMDFKMKHKQGHWVNILSRANAIFDEKGKAIRIVGTHVDITERKRAEEAIKDNEKRFRELIESLPQLFWTCRVDGPCDYLSKQWVEYTGIPEAEQLGYRWLEQLHPDDKDRTVSEWMEKVKTGKAFDIEFRIRRADEIYHWFKTIAVPIRDSNNNIIKWFGSNTDVDDLRRSLEAQERLVSIIESSTDMISYADLNANILYMNLAGKKILGLNADDDITKYKIENFISDDAKHDMFNITLPEIFRVGGWIGDSVFKDITGKIIPVALSCTLLKNKNGEPEFIAVNARDITERKRAEETLQESEERFRIAAETSNDVVYEWDLKQSVKWFGKIDEMLGYDPDEFPRTLDGLGASVHPEDWIRVMAAVQAHLEGRAPYAEEYRAIKKDGTFRWWSARGAVSRTQDGKPIRWVGTVTDITERKQVEEELGRFYEVSVEMMSIIGFDGCFKRLNPAWEKTLGFSLNKMLFQPFIDFVHPEDKDATLAEAAKLTTGARTISFENRYCCADGSYRWLSWSVIPAVNEELLYGVARDVTERKRAEEALYEAKENLERRVLERTAELTRSKQLLNETGRLARVGGWEIDLITGKNYWSETTKIIHEVEPDFDPNLETAINFYAPRSIPIITSLVDRLINHGEPFDTELELITAKKNRLWVRAIGQAYRDEGNIVKIGGVFQDINERKLAEQEIERRSSLLEAANKELEAFTYSVSHDLRAPLRHISGYVELLSSRFHSALSDKGQHYLDSIADSVHQMGLLIDNLLQFSRTGRAEMRRTDSHMNGIINEVIESLGKDNPDRSIEWTVAKLPSVFCDSAMMRLVWMNLLSNAVKFTRTREKALIEIGVKVEKKEVIFFVRDNGVGFDMQYAQKLFGVFQRLHPTEEFEGTGIGLANVHRIIMRHGGRTWAEAELDKGATFYFSI